MAEVSAHSGEASLVDSTSQITSNGTNDVEGGKVQSHTLSEKQSADTSLTSHPVTKDESVSAPITEANVSAEVDRILNLINVNSFMKEDLKPTNTKLESQLKEATDPQPPPITSIDDNSTIPPITSILAKFVSTATPSLLTPALRDQLYECILDYLAVTAAGATLAPSSQPIFNAITAFAGIPIPEKSLSNGSQPASGNTVLTLGQSFPKPYAALLNAAFGHSLDFDDTHADSSLHAGVTAIPTVLAEAESNPDVTSDDILLAIILSYEITIRLGIALSSASYVRGFHMTSTAGIFGAVAAICSLRKLSKEVLENAWGLAGSKAAGSMQYLSNGSHNKRLHPGFAAHDAFMCVALAEAGVSGADKIIEGELGLLQAYTERDRADVNWNQLKTGLGTEWEFSKSALKPFAGCRMTHGFIELADSLGKKFRSGVWNDIDVTGIKKIRCLMPKNNMILIGQRTPNKVHPENMVDAQFSCYFQVANAFIYGMSHDMAAYDRLQDEKVKAFCEKVECVVDETMKVFGCRIDAFLEDENGEVAEIVRREILEPLGEKSHPFAREGVESKFLGLMKSVYGEERSREVMKYVENLTRDGKDASVKGLLDLVAWPVKE